jgi:hypothetical protein
VPDVESITVTYQRKVQLDQYEPITHEVELSVSLDEDDDPEEVYDEYSDRAEDFVERAIVRRLQQKELSEDD